MFPGSQCSRMKIEKTDHILTIPLGFTKLVGGERHCCSNGLICFSKSQAIAVIRKVLKKVAAPHPIRNTIPNPTLPWIHSIAASHPIPTRTQLTGSSPTAKLLPAVQGSVIGSGHSNDTLSDCDHECRRSVVEDSLLRPPCGNPTAGTTLPAATVGTSRSASLHVWGPPISHKQEDHL